MTDLLASSAWLDSPAGKPGGALAVDKQRMLGPFDVVPGSLIEGESGVHRFGVEAQAGVVLQARVATDAFEPVVILVGPGGQRWDLSARARSGGGPVEERGGGAPEVVLPDTGEYLLVVTSRANSLAERALTTGEYRLTLLCDTPAHAVPEGRVVPLAPPSSRSGRFGAWESEPR